MDTLDPLLGTPVKNQRSKCHKTFPIFLQYYELCNLKPADILSGIVEKGPMFSKDEYAVILRLLHRSDPNSTTHALSTNEEKLGDIMSKAGVAV